MTRHRAITRLSGTALAALVLLPAAAPAKVTELGALPDDVRGSCPGAASQPDGCQAMTRTTGYQAKVGPERDLYRAPADGRIVAWSLALGNPNREQVKIFGTRYGTVPQAAVVVLADGAKLSRTVVAKAPLQKLGEHLGHTVQFPLATTLPIRKGQYVALTVPTWAPVMQPGVGVDTSWRSSRDASGCSDFTTQFALLGRRTSALFRCLYKTARLTYSATFVSDPTTAPER